MIKINENLPKTNDQSLAVVQLPLRDSKSEQTSPRGNNFKTTNSKNRDKGRNVRDLKFTKNLADKLNDHVNANDKFRNDVKRNKNKPSEEKTIPWDDYYGMIGETDGNRFKEEIKRKENNNRKKVWIPKVSPQNIDEDELIDPTLGQKHEPEAAPSEPRGVFTPINERNEDDFGEEARMSSQKSDYDNAKAYTLSQLHEKGDLDDDDIQYIRTVSSAYADGNQFQNDVNSFSGRQKTKSKKEHSRREKESHQHNVRTVMNNIENIKAYPIKKVTFSSKVSSSDDKTNFFMPIEDKAMDAFSKTEEGAGFEEPETERIRNRRDFSNSIKKKYSYGILSNIISPTAKAVISKMNFIRLPKLLLQSTLAIGGIAQRAYSHLPSWDSMPSIWKIIPDLKLFRFGYSLPHKFDWNIKISKKEKLFVSACAIFFLYALYQYQHNSREYKVFMRYDVEHRERSETYDSDDVSLINLVGNDKDERPIVHQNVEAKLNPSEDQWIQQCHEVVRITDSSNGVFGYGAYQNTVDVISNANPIRQLNVDMELVTQLITNRNVLRTTNPKIQMEKIMVSTSLQQYINHNRGDVLFKDTINDSTSLALAVTFSNRTEAMPNDPYKQVFPLEEDIVLVESIPPRSSLFHRAMDPSTYEKDFSTAIAWMKSNYPSFRTRMTHFIARLRIMSILILVLGNQWAVVLGHVCAHVYRRLTLTIHSIVSPPLVNAWQLSLYLLNGVSGRNSGSSSANL